MTLETVKERYPKLAAKLPENVFTARELVVVDYNYDDIDSEEVGEFDPSEYNHFAYITEVTQHILGEEGLAALTEMIQKYEKFDDFFASEADLFGIQTALEEEEISMVLFEMIEEVLS